MKKNLVFLLVVVCLLSFVGCKASTEAQQPDTQPSQTQKSEYDILEPYFTGKVLEKMDGSCLVEVTDTGNGNFAVGQQVLVHINMPGCPEYGVGASLIISFDGKMTCSLPPQIVGVNIHVNE